VVSASDVQLPMKSMFPKPRPMTEPEIWKAIDGFGDCALVAKKPVGKVCKYTVLMAIW